MDLGETRVRVSKEPNGGEERKKEKEEKMMESGSKPLLYKQANRVEPDPVHSPLTLSRLIQILMDLDQSNALGALV